MNLKATIIQVLDENEGLKEKVYKYEKALEEITRQYDDVSVNNAKEIANEALGELTEEHRRLLQGYRNLLS